MFHTQSVQSQWRVLYQFWAGIILCIETMKYYIKNPIWMQKDPKYFTFLEAHTTIQQYVFICWVIFFYWFLLQQKEIWHKSWCFSEQRWDETMQTGCVWPSCSLICHEPSWTLVKKRTLAGLMEHTSSRAQNCLSTSCKILRIIQSASHSSSTQDFWILFSDKERKRIHI